MKLEASRRVAAHMRESLPARGAWVETVIGDGMVAADVLVAPRKGSVG